MTLRQEIYKPVDIASFTEDRPVVQKLVHANNKKNRALLEKLTLHIGDDD